MVFPDHLAYTIIKYHDHQLYKHRGSHTAIYHKNIKVHCPTGL